VTGKPEWQKPVTKDRNEVLSWLGANDKAAAFVREQASITRPFEELGREWLAGVEAGRISRRRGRGQPYSDTTIADYRRSYRNVLEPEFGPMVADEIGEVEWQMFVDRLASEGLSRSRIASHVAVASAIYSWALTPSRRFVSRNPLRLVELPPNDEKPRLRVAFAPEAAQLLAALEPADAVPYAIAFYAGLRRAELDRLDWADVLDEQGAIGSRLLVGRAKSAAGTERRPPIAAPLRIVLSEAWMRQGRPTRGRVVEVSVMSGKLAARAAKAWAETGLKPDHAPRVPPHVRVAAHGRRLHGEGARGVHGPRRPPDGHALRQAPAPARRTRRGGPPQRLSVARCSRAPVARGTIRLAFRCTHRSSSAAGISTSWPESTTFNSGCTFRSKWLRLIPSDAAASARVNA
jgi:integrase